MFRIVYTHQGRTWVVVPVLSNRLQSESDDEFIARVRARAVPSGADNISIVSVDEVPSDRTFRDAWKHDLSVDMPKARDIWRNKMRAVRAPKLDALDRDWNKAAGQKKPSDADAIEAKRQALRDVTADPAIDAALTPDDLKRVWPAILD